MARRTSAWLGIAALLASGLATPAGAQGTFQTIDPFYTGETARRGFFGDVSLSGEVAYRQADLLGLSEPGAPAQDVALSGRLDYAILSQVDLSAVLDLSGGVGGGPLGLSWVVVKPYWSHDRTDYAVRVAVDPASEGGLGFRQTDVAFLSSSPTSISSSTDFSLGFRRVRSGYEEGPIEGALDPRRLGGVAPASAVAELPPAEAGRVRLVGQELRASWGYNVLFDPAGSRFSIGLLGEAGDYTLVHTARGLPGEGLEAGAEFGARDRIRSVTAWARAGVEWSRPSYQIAPFVSAPLVTWASVSDEPLQHGPRLDKARFGVRLTLR